MIYENSHILTGELYLNNPLVFKSDKSYYTLSEAWSGVNWEDIMAAQDAFGTDFYDRSYTPSKASCLLSFW